MTKDLLKDKERGEEAEHFRREDAKLIETMRKRARLTEVAQALADKLRIDEAELLHRVVELGLNQETGTAILLAPLVQVAWADGHVTDAERRVILDLCASRGLTEGTPACDKVLEWLRQRPSDALFEAALEVMRIGLSVLPPKEREERTRDIVAGCRRVAEASGSTLGRLLGIHDGVSGDESTVLDAIAAKLRATPRSSA